jgi:DNA-directed RNA polymerase subunit H (RpoH/RPB5)
MNSSSSNLDLICTSFNTIKEMVEYRGKDTSFMNAISNSELDAMMSANSTSMVFDVKVSETCTIIYNLAVKSKMSDIIRIIPEDVQNVIIVFGKDKPSSTNIKNLMADRGSRIYEIFHISELLINISEHCLVSKHEIVAEKEVVRIMETYGIKVKTQFPIILKKDPMAKFINAQAGDLVKVTRSSPTAGLAIVYRYCKD